MGNAIGLAFFCVSYGFVCYCAWRYMGLPYKDFPASGEVKP